MGCMIKQQDEEKHKNTDNEWQQLCKPYILHLRFYGRYAPLKWGFYILDGGEETIQFRHYSV